MKFVAVSDSHNQLSDIEWPAGDVLLHAGDFTMSGTEQEVAKFNYQLGLTPYKYRIVIAGNHDWLFQKQPLLAQALLTNAIYLEDSGVALNPDKEPRLLKPGEPLVKEGGDIVIWGSPWQPWFYDWAFNLFRGKDLADKWSLIPEGVDVLITHGPPYGVGDVTSGRYGLVDRVGCVDLMERIKIIRPKVHVFGHIHGQNGIYEENGVKFINASTCDEDYDPVQRAREFEL